MVMALMTSPASCPNSAGISSGDGPAGNGGVSSTFPYLMNIIRHGAAFLANHAHKSHVNYGWSPLLASLFLPSNLPLFGRVVFLAVRLRTLRSILISQSRAFRSCGHFFLAQPWHNKAELSVLFIAVCTCSSVWALHRSLLGNKTNQEKEGVNISRILPQLFQSLDLIGHISLFQ